MLSQEEALYKLLVLNLFAAKERLVTVDCCMGAFGSFELIANQEYVLPNATTVDYCLWWCGFGLLPVDHIMVPVAIKFHMCKLQ